MNKNSFNNQYIALGEQFYERINPAPVANPTLIKFNDELGKMLGLSTDKLDSSEAAAIFSGNQIPEGAMPLAMATRNISLHSSIRNSAMAAQYYSASLLTRQVSALICN